jgi:hypothetical protein
MHIGLHVKYPLFLSDIFFFTKVDFFDGFFEQKKKDTNIKIQENPLLSETRVVPVDGEIWRR